MSVGGGEATLTVRHSFDHLVTASALIDALPSGIALLDDHGVIVDVNQRLADLTGYAMDELIGRDIREIVPLARVSRLVEACEEGSEPSGGRTVRRDGALTARRRSGRELSVSVATTRLMHEGTSWIVASIDDNADYVAARDIRAEPESRASEVEAMAAAAITESQLRFRLAFESNMAPMVCSGRDGLFIDVNDAFCRMTGRTRDELIGRDSRHFTYPDDIGITEDVYRRINAGEVDEARYFKRFVHTSGRIVAAEVSMCSARDQSGEAEYFISSVRDVTEEHALAAKLSFQALHDPLTGIANRTLFEDRLTQAHARAVRDGSFGAVLLIDLDDFKGVNDTYGHLIGDQLLITIAHRFQGVTRASDTLARFGGDEFLYLAEGLTTASEASRIAERLLAQLDEPFSFDTVHFEQRASIGIVVWDGTEEDTSDLIDNADAAMYEAKRLGSGHSVVFSPAMRHEAASRFSLVQDLHRAATSGELVMHFQPIVDLTTSDVVGFESLMRWHHPERGWVPPDVFIPLAEQSDLILDLGYFALHEAIAAATTWGPTGSHGRRPYVTVNLAARQFHDPQLVSRIAHELASSGLEPERLVLEVTEGVALLDIAETMAVMDQLNQLNIGVALDDFGTGYSSLSYLAALNPRIIKIDQSFVRPRHSEERSQTLLEAIVTLGNKLNMVVLAEGIETPAQLERLNSLECDLGQGFLWSPAVSNDEAMSLIQRSSSGPPDAGDAEDDKTTRPAQPARRP